MPKPKWSHRSWRTPSTPSRHWRTLACSAVIGVDVPEKKLPERGTLDIGVIRWPGWPRSSRTPPPLTAISADERGGRPALEALQGFHLDWQQPWETRECVGEGREGSPGPA